MGQELSIEQRVISLLADERRAFIARHLLTQIPQSTPALKGVLETQFPEVAKALSPWPRQAQNIGDICRMSLSTLGVVDSQRGEVPFLKGTTEGDVWYATPDVERFQNHIDFGFGMSEELGMSLFTILGYFAGGTLTSNMNRTKILKSVAERTQPNGDEPIKIMSLPMYNGGNGPYIYNHLKALEAAGIVKLTESTEFKDGQKKRYYWSSDNGPTPALAKKIIGKNTRKFFGLMSLLYFETTCDGTRSMHHFDIAKRSGYSKSRITRTLSRLEKAGVVNAISRQALVDVEITELGDRVNRGFLSPLLISLNGRDEKGYEQAVEHVRTVAQAFRNTGLKGVTSVMQRYATIPKTGYEK